MSQLNRPQLKKPMTDAWLQTACLEALCAGGDTRLAIDPVRGVNKYLCRPLPVPDTAILSSCTASPISSAGLAASMTCFRDVIGPAATRKRVERLDAWQKQVIETIARHLVLDDLADVILTASGTDAIQLVAVLMALEDNCNPSTAILPTAAETGTGVPLAATCRVFDGGGLQGAPLLDAEIQAIEVHLRARDGSLLSDEEIAARFSAAATSAAGRSIVYLTQGTKTGLVAPIEPPPGVEVVVDACQLRLSPQVIRRFLARGWPVAITGSKFLGGPAFSGALLLPKDRFQKFLPTAHSVCKASLGDLTEETGRRRALGTILRWVAASEALSDLPRGGDQFPEVMLRLTHELEETAAGHLPGAFIIDGPSAAMVEASGQSPGLITIGVHNPNDPKETLNASSLRKLYESLASRDVLVGQPVGIGGQAALRLAVSLANVTARTVAPETQHLISAWHEVVAEITV